MQEEYNGINGPCQGYFCGGCGQTVITGSVHGTGKCEPNPELVEQLLKLNGWSS